jgi:chromosome partitioning protein
LSKIYSILNFKGGTGKSTTSENLAEALRREGKRVLVIDGDRQRNASTTLIKGQAEPTLAEVLTGKCTLKEAMIEAKPGLYVVPGSTDLNETASHIVLHRTAYYTVQRQLTPATADLHLDYVLIDHAGAYTAVMEALLLASEAMLIPCLLEPYAVAGLFDMFNKLQTTLTDHSLENSGIIPFAVDLRYEMTRQYLKELREEFRDLITAPIRTDALARKAQSLQMTIFEYEDEYNEHSRAADDYRTLAQDIIEETQA